MYYTRKYKRKSRAKKALFPAFKYLSLFGILIAILLVVAIQVNSDHSYKRNSEEQVTAMPVTEPDEPDASSEIKGNYYGLCARNKVTTVDDFKRIVERDETLSRHFSDFDWSNATVGKLDKDTWTFVAYRRGDNIQLTSKPVKLPKGDGFISDGHRQVRTFCCNDYVLTPPPFSSTDPYAPVEHVDGPQRRMSKPAGPLPPPISSMSLGPPLQESAGSIPEFSTENISSPAVPHYNHVHRRYSSPERLVTPEPGTFYLMGFGLVVATFCGFLRGRRGRNRKEG